MPDTALSFTHDAQRAAPHAYRAEPATATAHADPIADLERRLALARPRLLRLAQLQGIAPDAAEDVAQEALLIGWRRIEMLRAPERFDAWLDGVCRNLCQHQRRSASMDARHLAPIAVPLGDATSDTWAPDMAEISDPQADDPLDELAREDLHTLLDRALGYLPVAAREALELRYLTDLSSDEAAARLGLTGSALDVRLHRARRQLRQTLNGPLRADAVEYGLALDDEDATGWRETRLWCMFCGHLRLHGRLDVAPDGRVNLHMRCPQCSQRIGAPSTGRLTESGPLDALRGLRSFRPAFNRQLQSGNAYLAAALSQRACLWCGAPVHVALTTPDDRPSFLSRWPGLTWVITCPTCDWLASMYAGWSTWTHPTAQQFMDQHPRWITEPETLVDVAGQPAIRARLADATSAAGLTVLLHAETLRVLATFPN